MSMESFSVTSKKNSFLAYLIPYCLHETAEVTLLAISLSFLRSVLAPGMNDDKE